MVVTFRMWQLHVREAERRAEEAERTRDEAAQRRAMEERLRIARELHDSLTHSISVIQVQAGVAEHLARKRGEEVPPALLAIKEAGTDAARELRATLRVLRRTEDGDASGLAHLDSLVSRARAAGQPVTVTVTGAARPLPPDVDQAAYRIVQEALTNVSRHAGRASACVRLAYDAGHADRPGRQRRRHLARAPAVAASPPGPRDLAWSACASGCRRSAADCTPGRRTGGGFLVRAELPVARAVMIRVLLADDQALIRSGIRALLDAEDDIEVVAEAADGKQAVALATRHRPDIALVDIQMPVVDGIEATRQIVTDERLAEVRVVILTNFGLDEYIFAGAAGGRERLPAQGHPAGRAAAGAAHRDGRVTRCCRPPSPAG